jgi:serine protease Do
MEFNSQLQNQIEEPQKQKKEGKSKVKGFFSTVAAGVVGSVLTLTIVTQTNLIPSVGKLSGNQVEQTNNPTTSNNKSSELAVVQPTSTNTSSSIADTVENASKAIVGIVNMQSSNQNFSQSTENQESGSGSGVIFKKDGNSAYIVTNNHVIEGAKEIEVSFESGEKTTAELIGADALTDLAVLKIDAKYANAYLEFGDSSTLRSGDQVLAIGNPLGLDLSRTVTQGIVSAVDREIAVSTSAGDWDLNVIQTDAAINPGNSGGALINTQGQVIGINSLKISDSGVEGLGFAIPSNDLVPIINEIIDNGKVERPYMGISLASLAEIPQQYLQGIPNTVTSGVMVTNIDQTSVAAKAGLQVQDLIVSINGSEVKSSVDLRKYLYTELKVGDKVTLKVYHQGELKTINMTLTSNTVTN